MALFSIILKFYFFLRFNSHLMKFNESGIPLTIEIWNLSSSDKQSGIHWYLLRRIHNPILPGIPLHGAISMGALFLTHLRRVDVNEFRVKSYAILSLQPRKPIFLYFSKILILLAEIIHINFLIYLV